MSDIWAYSGLAPDIQAAVDSAESGDTVYLPSGTFDFVVDPTNIGPVGKAYGVIISGGVNVIGQGKNNTILRESVDPPIGTPIFLIDGRNGLRTRISGIGFEGFVVDTEATSPDALHFLGAKDYRADHCRFTNWTGSAIHQSNNYLPYGANRGLVDHCDFDNPYKGIDGSPEGGAITPTTIWGYGISPIGTYYNWEPLDSILGKYTGVDNIVYVEDCTFSRCREAIASAGGAFYVARHNTFYGSIPRNFHSIDVHGGGRGLEAYNNILIGQPYPGGAGYYNIGFGLRGGGGVIFNNRLIDTRTGIVLNNDMVNEQTRIKDLYLWGNTMERQNMPASDYMTLLNIVDPAEIVEGVDFFLYERPGYTPYIYPHPLSAEFPHELTVNSNLIGVEFKLRRVG